MGLWMFNASPQKRKSCFYLADFCSGRFMHSGLQPLVTFSKMTVPIPFCGGAGCCRAACKWDIDNVQKLGLFRNAVCSCSNRILLAFSSMCSLWSVCCVSSQGVFLSFKLECLHQNFIYMHTRLCVCVYALVCSPSQLCQFSQYWSDLRYICSTDKSRTKSCC